MKLCGQGDMWAGSYLIVCGPAPHSVLTSVEAGWAVIQQQKLPSQEGSFEHMLPDPTEEEKLIHILGNGY